jgi:hypothetical protein
MELQYRKVFKEAITGIAEGKISNPSINEFIVSTYSGRVVGFMSQ